MKEVLEYLKACGTFYIATVDENKPRVRPFGAVCEYEGKIYIATNNTKKVFKQIVENPYVEISGMSEGSWIRLEGKVYNDDRREAKEAVLEACPSLKHMYSLDDGIFAVMYFESGKADICSFTAAPVTYEF